VQFDEWIANDDGWPAINGCIIRVGHFRPSDTNTHGTPLHARSAWLSGGYIDRVSNPILAFLTFTRRTLEETGRVYSFRFGQSTRFLRILAITDFTSLIFMTALLLHKESLIRQADFVLIYGELSRDKRFWHTSPLNYQIYIIVIKYFLMQHF